MLLEGPWRWVGRTGWGDAHALGQLPGDLEGWLACLSELARTRGEGMLIACTDRTSELLIRERSRIPETLRSFESANGAHVELMNKASLYALAAGEGIRIPWTLRLASATELERVCDEASYPCLVKPALSHQWRRLFGERRVLPTESPDTLRRIAAAPLEAGLELLVTEHVPGPDRNLEGAVTIRRGDGSYALAYGRRKVRQYPPGFGAGSVHESADVPETIDLAKRLLDAAGFVGISVCEAKRHAETGETVLIEVNVRVPQGLSLGDVNGSDASWRLYATLAGIPLPAQPPAKSGVKVVVPSLEPRAVVAGLLQRRLTLREVVTSYRGVRDFSGLSWRDPGPAAALAVHEIRRGIRFVRGFFGGDRRRS
jgi:D-aspartate ligase